MCPFPKHRTPEFKKTEILLYNVFKGHRVVNSMETPINWKKKKKKPQFENNIEICEQLINIRQYASISQVQVSKWVD